MKFLIKTAVYAFVLKKVFKAVIAK